VDGVTSGAYVVNQTRMCSAAPRQGDGALVLAANVDLEIAVRIPFNKFVLDEIVPFALAMVKIVCVEA